MHTRLITHDIKRKLDKRRYLVVPAGWTAVVPDGKPDVQFALAWQAAYQKAGMSPKRARAQVTADWRGIVWQGWRERLYAHVHYWGCEYVRMWPEQLISTSMCNDLYIAVGYQPEHAQHWILPGRNEGRAGHGENVAKLKEMRDNA